VWNLVYEEAKRFLPSHEVASWVNRRQLKSPCDSP
jgi:hypothetical protein